MVPHPFTSNVEVSCEAVVRRSGTIFAEFRRQDSGCVSFGVEGRDRRRWFVKHAGRAEAIVSLRQAIALHAAVRHAAIVPLVGTFTTADGPSLVYPWFDGEVLYAPADGRGSAARRDPASAHARFRAQPVDVILTIVDAIFDAHVAVERAGVVAVDLYDGCFLYDFHRRQVALVDLDEYRPGPFTVDGNRLPGSTRFMPPEHWRQGATVDHRSTVFLLGRTAQIVLDDGDDEGRWRASPELAAVADRATRPDPDDRYQSVAELVTAWISARN